MDVSAATQEQLKALVKRRHPEYASSVAHWLFCEKTYNGGRDWFTQNLHRYHKEGEEEFKKRVARAYRFNHTREVVDLVQKYIFKSHVARNETDAPDLIKRFWAAATISKLDIDQFMRLVCNLSSIFGRIWVFVDNNKPAEARSEKEEKESGAQIYAYTVRPTDVLDFATDDQGKLLWMLVRETVRDDEDPFTSSGEVRERFRLWMRESWVLLRIKSGRNKVVEVEDHGPNALGRIPAFPVDHVIGENRYTAPALINDIAYLDAASANYLSNLDAIIQDQTFSQLAIPAQSIMPGDEDYDALITAGTKRIFVYNGEGSAPEYISPDPKQAGVIVAVIKQIIQEIYHSAGMSAERSETDNAVGTDNSSGVAKAYDFDKLNTLLVAKADSLENAENSLVELVLAYGQKPAPEDELVKYPDTFDTRSLYDEFAIADRLSLLDAPKTLRQAQMEQIVEKIFPRIATDLKAKIAADLKEWPVDPVERAQQMAAATAPTAFPASGSKPAAKNPQTEKRQGQVTDKTQKKQAA